MRILNEKVSGEPGNSVGFIIVACKVCAVGSKKIHINFPNRFVRWLQLIKKKFKSYQSVFFQFILRGQNIEKDLVMSLKK